MADNRSPQLTTDDGRPIGDFQNAMTAGPRGPLLMQDVQLLEWMQHFNRERIPERVVHAKGSGAHGTFTVTNDITKYTQAKIFDRVGKQTPMLARFSTVAGEKGAADAERDVRGFALKFYTEDGNWDLVGNNTPVFFVRDPYKFQSFIHSQKRDPKSNLRDMDMQWDFWSQCPESLHQVTILMSDRGRPRTFRNMNGYSSHTYSLINDKNERVWVKFHFKTAQGINTMPDEESEKVIGKDRESHQRDLFNAIERGDYPKWNLYIQVMTQEQAKQFRWNPFDLTKVWPHGEFPLIEVGQMELNRNPENYFSEVEQAAFAPSSLIPGVDASPDKMLQSRLMSYADTHLYRLGVNYHQIPVNQPQCPYANYQKDGQMNTRKQGSGPVYHPNTRGGPEPDPKYKECPHDLGDDVVADRFNSREDHDDFTQPGDLWRLMPEDEKERTADAIAGGLSQAREHVQQLQLCHFFRADPDYGRRVAKRLNIEVPEQAMQAAK